MADDSWASSERTRRAMQSNRSRDTKPELALRRRLHAMGLRYRVCARPIPDVRHQADIVFRPAKVAVEVRGCFWHGCPDHHRPPRANSSYWSTKIERNRARDAAAESRLSDAGWSLLVVWEHESVDQAADRVAAEVRSRRPPHCEPGAGSGERQGNQPGLDPARRVHSVEFTRSIRRSRE